MAKVNLERGHMSQEYGDLYIKEIEKDPHWWHFTCKDRFAILMVSYFCDFGTGRLLGKHGLLPVLYGKSITES